MTTKWVIIVSPELDKFLLLQDYEELLTQTGENIPIAQGVRGNPWVIEPPATRRR
jgi:hypothetical protein